MCGRYVSKIDAALEREWALSRPPSPFESFNVAPGGPVPAVREREGQRLCELLRWGLVPSWARGVIPRYRTINARVETLAQAATWRGPWRHGRRCALPASGFYEWQVTADGKKQPWYIELADQPRFALAGLWDASVAADGSTTESCAIITLPANELVGEIHNSKRRMPAILRREDLDAWLSGDLETASQCLAPYPDESMRAWPVSPAVNNPRNDGAGLIGKQWRPDHDSNMGPSA